MSEQLRKALWMPVDRSPDRSVEVVSSKLQTLYDSIESCSDHSTLGTYKLKLRPTKKQKLTLRKILAASNMAWNWTKWLIEEKGFSKNDRKTTCIQLCSIIMKKS